MFKHNLIFKKLKKSFLSINDLIESYFDRFSSFIIKLKKNKYDEHNKAFTIIGTLIILTLGYFLLPTIYDRNIVKSKIQNQLFKKFNIEVRFEDKISYGLFPKPHFNSKNLIILNNKKKIAKIKNFKIFINFDKFFSINNVVTKNAIFKKADFNINKDDFCMNLENLDKSITKKTKAIIPVHLYGQMVNMKELIKISKKYKIDIIEDSSQSHGASYDNKKSGSFGKLSCFSFYPTKNLGCYGDGGAITTNSKSLYNKLLMMREYGWKPKFNSISYGLNSRLDEIHASVLRIKLKKLDNFNYKRIKLADKYFNEIKNKKIILPKINNLNKHVFHLFVIRTNKRDMLKKYLEKNKIITGIQYPIPIHKQRYFSKIVKFNTLTNTEIISNEILSLPIYPSLKIKYINKVIQILNKF